MPLGPHQLLLCLGYCFVLQFTEKWRLTQTIYVHNQNVISPSLLDKGDSGSTYNFLAIPARCVLSCPRPGLPGFNANRGKICTSAFHMPQLSDRLIWLGHSRSSFNNQSFFLLEKCFWAWQKDFGDRPSMGITEHSTRFSRKSSVPG